MIPVTAKTQWLTLNTDLNPGWIKHVKYNRTGKGNAWFTAMDSLNDEKQEWVGLFNLNTTYPPLTVLFIINLQCLTSLLKHSSSHVCSSGLYIHGSWKWQHVQLSINLGDTAQGLNENHMQEKQGAGRQEAVSRRQRGGHRERKTQKKERERRWGARMPTYCNR